MRKRLGLAIGGLFVLIGTSPGTIEAQPPADDAYEGVTPGAGHRPPAEGRLSRSARRRRAATASIITWPGFQPNADGSSRFFVQTTAGVTATVNRSEGRVEIVFPNTGTHLSNSRRWLETAFFETPVTRARLLRRRHDMVLVMYLRADVIPTVSSGTDASGYFFTYIDFAAGHYLPDAPPPMLEPRGGLSVVRSEPGAPSSAASSPPPSAPARDDASIRAMDDERPPPVSGPRP